MSAQNKSYSSKDRMLASLENQRADYIPCSFMLFSALCDRYPDEFEYVGRQMEMGLDPKVELPKLPLRFHRDVAVTEYATRDKDGEEVIRAEYDTPRGVLTQVVRRTADWPYGTHVPLLNDHLIPRSKKFLVTGEADLDALEYLFCEPTADDLKQFSEEARRRKRFADDRGLLLSGGWRADTYPDNNTGENANYGCMGFDGVTWLCGMTNAVLLAFDNPGMLERLLEIISKWTRARMQIEMDAGIDLLLRRAWYETGDIISPDIYRRFVAPRLREDIQLAHEAGVKIGNITTSGLDPLLDDIAALNLDVLVGVDPMTVHCGLERVKSALGSKMCLWGGVSGSLTIEMGNKEQIRKAVETCVATLGRKGGFILSPVDNITEDRPQTWSNIDYFLDVWKANRAI